MLWPGQDAQIVMMYKIVIENVLFVQMKVSRYVGPENIGSKVQHYIGEILMNIFIRTSN
jgi:hypothetical protein